MATIEEGILGPMKGSIANVTGYIRLGIPVLRIKSSCVSKNRSEKQRAVSAKFKLAMQFIKPVTGFINVGFSTQRNPGQTAHNVAVSTVLNSGIRGTYPELELNYPAITVAAGELPAAVNPQAQWVNDSRIRFSWEVNPLEHPDRRRDQVMLLAYSPQTERAFYLTSAARRASGEDFLEVYADFEAQTFETYIAFISDNRKLVSNSIYTGPLVNI